MTAPAITAPAPTPAPAQAPVVEPAPSLQQGQPPVLQPTVPSPAQQTVTKQNALERMIQQVGRKVTPEGQAFIQSAQQTDQHPVQSQGLDANQILQELTGHQITDASAVPPATLVDSPVAPEVPPPPTEITIQDAEGNDFTFRARNAQGEFANIDADRIYEWEGGKDKLTGEAKIYRKSLKDMMRLATDGIAMQKARDELNHYRQNVPMWQQAYQAKEQEVTTHQQAVDSLRNLVHELLTGDETWVVAKREEYAKQFSPEAELARLKREVAELRNGTHTSRQNGQPSASPAVDPQVQAQIGGFAQRTAPVIRQVEQLVGDVAALGKLSQFTTPLLRNGQIPPDQLPAVEAFITGDYLRWAQGESTAKTTAQQEAERVRQEAERIRAQAQLAANQVGSAMRPAGGLPSNAPVQLPPPRNREDAIQRIARGDKHRTQMTG